MAMPDAPQRLAERLVYDTRDLTRVTPFGARTIWRMWNSGRMPKPCRVGGRVVWPREVIEQWIRDGMPRCDAENERGGR